jgi:hypothetical protein
VAMTKAFVKSIEAFIQREGLELVRFKKGQRKDAVLQQKLRAFKKPEGVLFVGVAREKVRVPRTTRKACPGGGTIPWIIYSTAMVNVYYFYCRDQDFGPFFLMQVLTTDTKLPQSVKSKDSCPTLARPRQAGRGREFSEGGCWRVEPLDRGERREDIFLEDARRQDLIRALGEACQKGPAVTWHRVPMELDLAACTAYCFSMNAVEFTTELNGAAVLPILREIAARLPRAGKARVIVLTAGDTEEAEWRAGAYEQFMRDDSAEDTIYESLR